MPYELIPMACAAAATVAFALWAARRKAGTRSVTGACLIFFAALTLVGAMALHCGEIFYNALNGTEAGIYKRAPGAPHANLLGFTYDFRFYSLQLFGGALIYWASRLVRCSVEIAGGSSHAAPRAWKNVLYIVLLVAPLLPMHVFAVATTVLMGIAAIGLLVARRKAEYEVAATRAVALVPVTSSVTEE